MRNPLNNLNNRVAQAADRNKADAVGSLARQACTELEKGNDKRAYSLIQEAIALPGGFFGSFYLTKLEMAKEALEQGQDHMAKEALESF